MYSSPNFPVFCAQKRWFLSKFNPYSPATKSSLNSPPTFSLYAPLACNCQLKLKVLHHSSSSAVQKYNLHHPKSHQRATLPDQNKTPDVAKNIHRTPVTAKTLYTSEATTNNKSNGTQRRTATTATTPTTAIHPATH